MRKAIGFVLLFVGAALLAVGIVTTTWAPGAVKKTPIDVDSTTVLTGTGAKFDGATGELGKTRPVRATSFSQVDSDASTDEVAVFVQSRCVVYTDQGDVDDCPSGEDARIFTIPEPDKFATDRKTALAVDQEGFLPADEQVVQHEGLINKFPFDTEARDYLFWDGLTKQAWPAVFDGNEDINGTSTRHFTVTIADAAVDEVSKDIPGTYSNTIETWVEPRTGSIVRQASSQQRYFEDGTQVLDLNVEFTDDQVSTNVDEADDNVASLDLLTRTMPLVGFVGGALLLLAGAFLVLSGRQKPTSGSHVEDRDPVSV